MTAIRKRRWLVVIVAIVVVAGVVGFVVFREDPPRLVILKQEQVNGEKRVVFRLDAPKHTGAVLDRMSTVVLSTGKQRRPVLQVGGALHQIMQVPPDFFLSPPLVVEAGESAEFSVSSPVDDVWRLSCKISLREARTEILLSRVVSCWDEKSLAPLRTTFDDESTTRLVESDPITNAVPRTADAPAR